MQVRVGGKLLRIEDGAGGDARLAEHLHDCGEPGEVFWQRRLPDAPRRNDSTYLRTKCAFPNQPIVATMTEA
jgi:hypothetical protein